MPTRMTILDAMEHPDLFGPLFKNDSWRPSKAALAAIFGLPFDDYANELFKECTGRETQPTKPFKEVTLIVGRRGAKRWARSSRL